MMQVQAADGQLQVTKEEEEEEEEELRDFAADATAGKTSQTGHKILLQIASQKWSVETAPLTAPLLYVTKTC